MRLSKHKLPASRQAAILARILPTLLIAAPLGLAGCGPSSAPVSATPASVQPVVNLDEVRPEVERFCGDCHATPLPESFPQDRWLHEVERGYEFYLLSGRSDLKLPRRSDVVEFYRSQAPERLEFWDVPPPGESPRFLRSDVALPTHPGDRLAVSHILPLQPKAAGSPAELVFCDMRSGAVTWASIGQHEARATQSVQLHHPSHVVETDLDGDGRPDYVVCDLGSFLPEDHSRGRVVWLRPDAAGSAGEWEQVVLLEGVGRVADAQPADFTGNGQLDIIVAVFGWQSSGGIVLLRREGEENGRPRFVPQWLDEREGTIHVPVADLNGDGRPDFVALISQEHESIEAFLNRGDGTFDKQVLYRAPDPSWGSSGIQLVDLDGDGDLDVLYTNGDTFDSYYAKPYHGIRWIENRGEEGWKDHLLANLPGVSRAVAADLDGDGELDIVACSFIPRESRARHTDVPRFSSLIWLEQQDGRFVRHELEQDLCHHATLDVIDVNGNGALDIVVGNFGQWGGERLTPWTLWLNGAGP
jgi:hypothetical protein